MPDNGWIHIHLLSMEPITNNNTCKSENCYLHSKVNFHLQEHDKAIDCAHSNIRDLKTDCHSRHIELSEHITNAQNRWKQIDEMTIVLKELVVSMNEIKTEMREYRKDMNNVCERLETIENNVRELPTETKVKHIVDGAINKERENKHSRYFDNKYRRYGAIATFGTLFVYFIATMTPIIKDFIGSLIG